MWNENEAEEFDGIMRLLCTTMKNTERNNAWKQTVKGLVSSYGEPAPYTFEFLDVALL